MNDTPNIVRELIHVTGLSTGDPGDLWETNATLYDNGHVEFWVTCNNVRQDVYPPEIAQKALERWAQWLDSGE